MSKLQDLVHVAFKADPLVTLLKALPEKAIRLTGIVTKHQKQVKEPGFLQNYRDCTNKQHLDLKAAMKKGGGGVKKPASLLLSKISIGPHIRHIQM